MKDYPIGDMPLLHKVLNISLGMVTSVNYILTILLYVDRNNMKNPVYKTSFHLFGPVLQTSIIITELVGYLAFYGIPPPECFLSSACLVLEVMGYYLRFEHKFLTM